MLSFWDIFPIFWARHPALLYGIAAFIGACCALSYLTTTLAIALFALIALPTLFLSVQKSLYAWRCIFAITLCLATYTLTGVAHQEPNAAYKETEGIAHFSISSISTSKVPFQKSWAYKGILYSFHPTSKDISKPIATNIPIHLMIPQNEEKRPDASYDYQLPARLKRLEDNRYALIPTEKTSWSGAKKTWNLTEWRFQAKAVLAAYIQKHIKDPHVSSFLTGVATGDFNDRILSYELSRFGLQHLMAISGLHFAILASILGFFFRLFFTVRLSAVLLIAVLSAYFLFLGSSPSVIRAWFAIVLGLVALLIEKQSAALNSLGLALLFMAFWDPFSARQIGFQFSFAVTASILLWFPLCDQLLQRYFPKRPLTQAVTMNWLDRHAYCILFFFRQAIALGIAVNLIALPLTLFYFQKFPLLGLVYNLFFPFLITFSLLLLLVALPITFVFPWLGSGMHAFNELYTRFVLDFTFKLPKGFDLNIHAYPFSAEVLIGYVVLVFTIGILAKNLKSIDENYEIHHDSPFPWRS